MFSTTMPHCVTWQLFYDFGCRASPKQSTMRPRKFVLPSDQQKANSKDVKNIFAKWSHFEFSRQSKFKLLTSGSTPKANFFSRKYEDKHFRDIPNSSNSQICTSCCCFGCWGCLAHQKLLVCPLYGAVAAPRNSKIFFPWNRLCFRRYFLGFQKILKEHNEHFESTCWAESTYSIRIVQIHFKG